MTTNAPLILAADIGGTNTRVALLDATSLRAQTVTRYQNAKSSGLEDILRHYMDAQGAKPDAVSLALAGPIENGSGRLTNLDWAIDTASASAATDGAMGVLLNDLQAQGRALPFLAPQSLKGVQTGDPSSNEATCLMIGIGTGLNVAPVHRVGGQTYVPAAEAGHISFSARDAALGAFEKDLEGRLGHVAAEDIMSGRGLERAYRHVTGHDLAASDVMALCGQSDKDADTAVGLLVRALGHFCGDMALAHLPLGGIYLVGGVARALLPFMDKHGFLSCFADKGRFSGFMGQFPISVVEDDYAALVGAASYAQERLNVR
ncbi:ROK family protein [Planktotalea sp.]|uniref:glucokinase n=1 Tax=Planktotalea sp. TaxID=2029877 RepID=UPI003F6D59A0